MPIRPLKHKKPRFSPGKTEVRSRCGCAAQCLPGSKIHPLWPLLAQNSVAKRSTSTKCWRPNETRMTEYTLCPWFRPFGLQIPLECMCIAVLRPNIFDTALIFRKTDVRVAEMSINILSSVVKIHIRCTLPLCKQWPGSHYVMGGGWELLKPCSL